MVASPDPVPGGLPPTPIDDVPAVIARARRAFGVWSALTHGERRFHLGRLKRTVLARGEEIARTVASETGKSVTDAYAFDVLTALTVIDHYGRRAERYLSTRRATSWPFLTTRAWTEYHPRGVAGVITPWNYPFFLPVIPTVTALAAGCTVVLKPSEVAPLSGALLADLCDDAGLPKDVVGMIHGGPDVGAALVDAGVDVVAFTGSTKAGRQVARAAAERLVPAVLELGGNDPMLVLEDADVAQAARAAVFGSMLNAGQTCVGIERAYVVDAVFDEFVSRLTREVDRLSVGTGDGSDIGPIAHPPQVEVLERHVRDAVDKGAQVVRGGVRVEGADGRPYYRPTILVGVDHSMLVAREETFGPVLPVMRVPDEAAAIEAANDTGYGLHASVWTSDRTRGESVASRLDSGTVAINDVAVNFIVPGLSFGGTGDSGAGVNFGAEGIRTYCVARSVTAARLRLPTTRLLGAWFPRRLGLRYWKALARILYRW